MNILHVIPGLTRERGGPTAVVQALVRYQVEAGHTVAVLTTDQGARHGEHAVEIHPAAATVRLPVRGPDRVAYTPGFAREIRMRLRTCDVVHVHSVFTYPVHVTLREAALAGVPLVLRPCGHLHRYSLAQSRWQKRLYLRLWGGMVRKACTVWHFTSEQESQNSWPWDSSQRFVLPNGIDPMEFAIDREEARKTIGRIWPQLERSPYVLFLGRLHPKKRLDLLLEAFFTGAPPEFKLVVVGPDECGLWNQLAARWRHDSMASGRVVRVGTVAGNMKTALLAGASLFALPSEHENFGIAALEALAAGTPVVLSPHVDLAAAVVKAGLGYVLPLEVSSWRDGLAQILAKDLHQTQQVAATRQWISEHYSWHRITGQLDRHYYRVLDRKTTPARKEKVRLA